MFWVQFNGMRYINSCSSGSLKMRILAANSPHPNSVTSKGGFSTMRTGRRKDSKTKGYLETKTDKFVVGTANE